MAGMTLDVAVETFPLAAPFRISGYVFHTTDVVVVTIGDGVHHGRGEASGVYYLGDDVAHMRSTIDGARAAIEGGITRDELRTLLPPGGARNAIDAALWELEARRTGTPVWALAGLNRPSPLITTFTLGADDPERMAQLARHYAQAKSIKVKLTGDLDLDVARVKAIRTARPDVWLGVDGNQGFVIDDLDRLVCAMIADRVSLIEQPLARGHEEDLDGYDFPIPIAADESALTLADVAHVAKHFDVFNIKLDKCGGLTEALMIAKASREAGLQVMVGNMTGSSLAMAPAFVLGQLCDFADLDGPIFLAQDRVPAVTYRDGLMWCDDTVWGAGAGLNGSTCPPFRLS